MARRYRRKNSKKAIKRLVFTLTLALLLFALYTFLPNDILALVGIHKGEVVESDYSKILASTLGDDELRVHFVDVGQGDAIVLQFPDGKNMIIDGGDKSKSSYEALKTHIDALGIKKFDYLMLTHSDADHVGGLDDVVRDYDVIDFYLPDVSNEIHHTTVAYRDFLKEVESEVKLHKGEKEISSVGDKITGEGYEIEFYMPTDEIYEELPNKELTAHQINSVSPIMVLTYDDAKVMFTGDTNLENEEVFIELYKGKRELDVDVLKVAHHGSREATTNEFLNIAKPEYAVISCGKDNKYSHPHKETLDRLNNFFMKKVYRTDTNGNVILTLTDSGEGKAEIAFATENAA